MVPQPLRQTARAVPVMVHDGRRLHIEVSFAPDVRIMTKQDVSRLEGALLAYAAGLASTTLWDNQAPSRACSPATS